MINLTKPTKKSGNGKSEKMIIKGHEKKIAEMRVRHQMLDSMETEQEMDKTSVVEDVMKKRLAAEVDGQFYRVALVESEDGVPAKVVFKNTYRQIDVAHEAALRGYVGEAYEQLFETRYNVKLRNDQNISKLKELLGDHLDLLFDVIPYVSPKNDAMEKRATLRGMLTKEQNNNLDEILGQVQYKPQFSLK